MFRFAIGRDIIPFNPCPDMPKPAIEHQKDRVLSDDEIKTHWHVIMASTEMSDLTRHAGAWLECAKNEWRKPFGAV